MDVDIRQHIHESFKNADVDEIKESIVSGVESNDELVLPGLGVFFEIVWKNSNEQNKEHLLTILHNGLRTDS